MGDLPDGGMAARMTALMLVAGLIALVMGLRGWRQTLRDAATLWRQIRGNAMPRLRLSEPPLLLPPGLVDPVVALRPAPVLRWLLTLGAVGLLAGMAWFFDLPHDPVGVWLFTGLALPLLWALAWIWTWAAEYDATGITWHPLLRASRHQDWRDLVLVSDDGPLLRSLHFTAGPGLTLPIPLVGGARLFQMAEGHLFRTPHDAGTARG